MTPHRVLLNSVRTCNSETNFIGMKSTPVRPPATTTHDEHVVFSVLLASEKFSPSLGGERSGLKQIMGCREGWANHFSVQTRKESALIIEFVVESHVAELVSISFSSKIVDR